MAVQVLSGYPTNPSCQIAGLAEMLEQHIGFKTDGRFVDVGAYDGKQWSNTWPLARIGWEGLAIEPEPDLYKQCIEAHRAKAHKVECVQVAIADYEGQTTLWLGGSVSLIQSEATERFRERWPALHKFDSIMVGVTTLDLLLADRSWDPGMDVVSIDAKGVELEVLRGFDLEYWEPSIVIIETGEENDDPAWSAKFEPIDKALTLASYRHIFGNWLNSVYVRSVL